MGRPPLIVPGIFFAICIVTGVNLATVLVSPASYAGPQNIPAGISHRYLLPVRNRILMHVGAVGQASGKLFVKPGNWVCRSCGELKFSHKKECRRCGVSKPDDAIAKKRSFAPVKAD